MNELLNERPKMFRSNPIGFLASIALIPLFGLGLLILFVWWLKAVTEKIVITPNEVLVERGILNRDRTEIAIGGIRTINVYQSLINRMMGVGKLMIYTSGDNPEVTIVGIADPNRVRDIVRRQQAQAA